MNYISISEFEDYIGAVESADLIESTGADYTRILTSSLNYAEGEVDGYAGKLYTIPLPASNLVKKWALAIARLDVFYRAKGKNPPEKYITDYDKVVKQLVDMANGMVIPPPDTSGDLPTSATTAGNSIDVTSDTSVMDETSMKDF